MRLSSRLPRAPSPTRSSRSATSDGGLDTPVQFVKGVGPKLGAVLRSRDISTVRDLLTFFPRAYEDRSRLLKVAELPTLAEGASATVQLRVNSTRRIPLRNRGPMLEARCSDESGGTISLKWFYFHKSLEGRLAPGARLMATGQVKSFMNRPEMVHPEITAVGAEPGEAAESEAYNVGRVVPVYTEIEGIPTRRLRKIIWEALEAYGHELSEDLPGRYLSAHGLPFLADAVREVHFPTTSGAEIPKLLEFATPSHQRLVYEEFFKFEYLVLRQRLSMAKEAARALEAPRLALDRAEFEGFLPFKLTAGQAASLTEILDDLSRPHPMNRMIQGDVGSGKTAVAFVASGCVLAQRGQAALMAPTEILAEQHYANAVRIFGGKLNVALLTGSTPASERERMLGRLGAGDPMLLIGTHALLEDPVRFTSLDLVMIDEQHRFGVEQRRTLRQKGVRDGLNPHHLILTATPIPRTLALTAYGDLAVSSIRELPPGRTAVKTKVVTPASRASAFQMIRNQLREGRQAYFIYPLVNESEAEGFTSLKSAVAEAETLARDTFPEFRVGLLHGQMRSDEKSRIMTQYKRHELDLLVSTTVVEVGVDVPNATVIAIEHAERFGLSQLHQLRGRVGRGTNASYCFLFTSGRVGETSGQRLDVLEQTNDGFKIAEADLEIRGPGEFLGTRQSGGLPFRLANLIRDREWLLRARDDAEGLLHEDPDLQKADHRPLRLYYQREGSAQFERLRTS